MESPLKFLVIMLVVQLFFSAGINAFIYALPDSQKVYAYGYSEVGSEISSVNITSQVQKSITRQTNIPILDAGALLFYSGNILLDLFMNFVFAIPEMIALVFQAIMDLFSIDIYLTHIMQIFISTIVMLYYFIAAIQLIIGIRTGKVI